MNKLLTMILLNKLSKSSGSDSVYPPDWSEIGYSNTPQSIVDGFNYAKNIKDNWDSSITSMANMYNSNANLKYFPLVDTSNVTNMYRAFLASNISDIGLIDISKVTSNQQMFSDCKNLVSISLLDFSNALGVSQLFSNCTNLRDVPLFNFSKVTDIDRTFSNCPNLSNESLNNILAMCTNSNVTNNSYKKLSRVGLSSTQATTCTTLSNWADAQSAGWTTGY